MWWRFLFVDPLSTVSLLLMSGEWVTATLLRISHRLGRGNPHFFSLTFTKIDCRIINRRREVYKFLNLGYQISPLSPIFPTSCKGQIDENTIKSKSQTKGSNTRDSEETYPIDSNLLYRSLCDLHDHREVADHRGQNRTWIRKI